MQIPGMGFMNYDGNTWHGIMVYDVNTWHGIDHDANTKLGIMAWFYEL